MTSTTDAADNYSELRAQLATLTTEAFRPELSEIDQLSTLEIAQIMNGEDASVPTAVAEQLPQIAAAIDGTAERMARGGRLVYAGAGTAGGSASWTRPSARPRSTPTRARSSV